MSRVCAPHPSPVRPLRARWLLPVTLALFCSWSGQGTGTTRADGSAGHASAGVDAPSGLERWRALIEEAHYAEAEALARSLLAEAETAQGRRSAEAAQALDLLVESLWRGGKLKDPEARQLAERAVATKEGLFGADHLEVARSLGNLGALLRDAGDFPAARTSLERALAIREAILGPEHPEVAKSLNDLARLDWRTGDFAGARSLYERALAIRERALGPDDPLVSQTLDNFAVLLWNVGEFDRAREMYERCILIDEKTLGPEHPDVASTLSNLAILQHQTGHYTEARRLYERAVAIFEKRLGPDHLRVAKVKTNLALLLEQTGDYPAARSLFESAQTIFENSLPPTDGLVGTGLMNLAALLKETGEYAEARRLFDRALATQEKNLGADHPDVALTLDNLEQLLELMGEYSEAKSAADRSLAIREKSLGPEHIQVAYSLAQIGRLERLAGRSAEARAPLERALSIREKTLGPEHAEVADSLAALAALWIQTGDPARAAPLLVRALRIEEKALGPDHPMVAETLMTLGDLLGSSGDHGRERQLYERALAIRQKALGPDHPVVAQSLMALAKLLEEQGDGPAALDVALRAEEIGRAHLRLNIRTLSERQALRYASVRVSGLDVALSSAQQALDPSTISRLWDSVIRSRALVLDEMAVRHHAVVGAADPDLFRLRDALGSARRRLANLTLRGPDRDQPDRYAGVLEEARHEEEASERSLAEKSAEFRDEQRRDRVGLSDVVRSLPAGSALLAYARYDRFEPGAKSRERHPSYLALVLKSSDADPALVPLGPATAIDALVREWRGELSSVPPVVRGAAARAEDRARKAGDRLRRSIWDPVSARLAGSRIVFIVPDGALNLVSFAALPAGHGTYLVERPPLLHYVSTERDLLRSSETRATGKGLLVLGGPDYETPPAGPLVAHRVQSDVARAAVSEEIAPGPERYRGSGAPCTVPGSMRFSPLPGARAEADEVAELWLEQAARVDGGPGDVVKLQGPKAGEAAVKAMAAGHRVVHLATHGFFIDDLCPQIPAGEHQDEPGVHGDIPQAIEDSPLLFSGLAFAGANRRASAVEGGEDGILTAEEIASLDLSGVEWAVLSGCESGMGRWEAGEGVLGLRRAFEVAGAHTLIMSLWQVEDGATRSWMKRLYKARLAGLSTAEALRRASLEVLQARRRAHKDTHPFYWGAFIATGDWR
jgi:CHAT domain-containing protein/tetratricopeptide (TPR) repeat protein